MKYLGPKIDPADVATQGDLGGAVSYEEGVSTSNTPVNSNTYVRAANLKVTVKAGEVALLIGVVDLTHSSADKYIQVCIAEYADISKKPGVEYLVYASALEHRPMPLFAMATPSSDTDYSLFGRNYSDNTSVGNMAGITTRLHKIVLGFQGGRKCLRPCERRWRRR